MNTIANILFDFGNVIIDIDIPGATERMAAFCDPAFEASEYRNQVLDLVAQLEVNAIAPAAFINGVLEYTTPDIQKDDVISAWNSMLVAIPQYRLTMLEQLKQNFNVLMLSNTNQIHIEWVYNYLESIHNIDNFESRFFDDVYYSHQIGARKPEIAAFQHVIDNSLITPEKTLFIDDVQENLNSASLLGFQTMLSPPEEEIAETLKILGYY